MECVKSMTGDSMMLLESPSVSIIIGFCTWQGREEERE